MSHSSDLSFLNVNSLQFQYDRKRNKFEVRMKE